MYILHRYLNSHTENCTPHVLGPCVLGPCVLGYTCTQYAFCYACFFAIIQNCSLYTYNTTIVCCSSHLHHVRLPLYTHFTVNTLDVPLYRATSWSHQTNSLLMPHAVCLLPCSGITPCESSGLQSFRKFGKVQ